MKKTIILTLFSLFISGAVSADTLEKSADILEKTAQSDSPPTSEDENVKIFDEDEYNKTLDDGEYNKRVNEIIIAGGSPFGLRFSISGAICGFMLADDRNCMVRPIKNSGEAISLVQSGAVNFALVQSDWLAHARDGTSRFSDIGKSDNLLSIATFSSEEILVVVNKDSTIVAIKDLQNRSVDIGKKGTYRHVVSNVILDSVGLEADDINVSHRTQGESIEALCKGNIDATVFVMSSPNTILDKMTGQCNVKILSLSKQQQQFMSKKLKGFYSSKVPAETYWEQNEAIETVGLYTTLIANKDSDKDIIEKMKSIILKNKDALSVMHPTLHKFSNEISK